MRQALSFFYGFGAMFVVLAAIAVGLAQLPTARYPEPDPPAWELLAPDWGKQWNDLDG